MSTRVFRFPQLPLVLLPLLAACAGAPGSSDGGDGDAGPDERLTPYQCLVSTDCPRRLVAAHRGDHHQYPENSLAAIRAAAELGADFVEVDVRHTADDRLVLMHDDSVDRTTDGSGAVVELTLQQLQQLQLEGGTPGDPESSQVPTFPAALELARQLGIMLYVDQKTERWELVLAAIQAGGYHHTALVRDPIDTVAAMAERDGELLVMPPCDDLSQLGQFQQRLPRLLIVELAGTPASDTVAAFHQAGVKVQMDAMALGDSKALVGDYTGWRDFVQAGVDLIQTDFAHLFVPALRQWEETGVFPAEGPPAL
ncbi:MAG: hypothetical protein DRI34_00020 [Deltaproteobacteria bacterium]|nr:MAG: hypothetical protein DRI34_00020 [Deltaproteobacteria bacterium]